MKKSTEEQISEVISSLGSKIVEIQARLDSVESAVVLAAMKYGMTKKEATKLLSDARQVAHQQRLEKIESKNPAFAAALDNRRQSTLDSVAGLL